MHANMHANGPRPLPPSAQACGGYAINIGGIIVYIVMREWPRRLLAIIIIVY